jgi:hypothetical protein
MISIPGLVVRSQDYLRRHGKDLASEAGGVPLPLAAVLGVLHGGTPGWFWHIPRAAQRALNVGKGASPALQLWAGLHLVNVAARTLDELSSAVGLDVRSTSGAAWWTAVLQLEALGPRTFVDLCSMVGSAHELCSFVDQVDPGPVRGLAEGAVVYRTLAPAEWVKAAVELARGSGVELLYSRGELIDSRDGRVRAIARKASTIGYAALQLATLVHVKYT